MRERFGNWGADLSDGDYACALAAAGVLCFWADPSWSAERLAEELRGAFARGEGTLPWRLSGQMDRFDPEVLLRAWRQFGLPAHIEIRRPAVRRIDLDELTAVLSRPEVRAASVRVVRVMKGLSEPPPPADKGSSSYAVLEESATSRPAPPKRPKPPPEAATPQPRFLQARLSDETEPDHPQEVRDTLRAGRTYRAAVRIGLPDREWRSVEQPFPDEKLPEQDGNWLTVIFWGPRVSPKPQVQRVWLPPKGNSQEAGFPFEVPEGVGVVSVRITVLHANRVLQTGVLRATVGLGRPWTFRLDATPRTRLEGLSTRSQFDMALVLNHDDEGTPRMTAAAGDQAAVISLDGGALTKLTEYLSKWISKIARAPEQYSTLSSPGTVELLRALAQKGGALHDYLRKHTRLGAMSEAKRVHLTSAKAESFFPVELLYRFDPPDETAGLCPNAAVALQAGECPGGCPADKRQHVCPLGFWGLSRIIERFAHTPEHDDIGRDFRLQSEPHGRNPLPLSGRSLLAASGRASEVKKEAMDELHQALEQRGSTARVTSWKEWIEHIRTDRPALLVLIPHHEQIDGDEFLEIGEGDRLQSELVREEHVSRGKDLSPIVLLLGCETNLARIAFDNLVIRFRDRGAAIVVSTIATILGRHASPAAARLVELLDEEAREGNSTFGEVMVRLRRKLLETESPMALGLTAYGDADWILTRVE